MYYNKVVGSAVWARGDAPLVRGAGPQGTSVLALPCPVRVTGKFGGRYKRAVEAVAVAVGRDKILIVLDEAATRAYRASTAPQLDEVDARGRRWIDLWDFNGVEQCYHFTRKITKLFTVLGQIGRAGAAAVNKARRAEAEARDPRLGTCPVCMGDFVADRRPIASSETPTPRTGGLVLHGYQRPGDGAVIGKCPGVSYSAWEISAEGAVHYVRSHARPALEAAQRHKVRLADPACKEVTFPGYEQGLLTLKCLKRGEAGFQQKLEDLRVEARREVARAQQHLDEVEARIAVWAPKPWPRILISEPRSAP